MLTSINLNNKSSLTTYKVATIGTDGLLSDELAIRDLPIAQFAPKRAFRIGLLHPEYSSNPDCFAIWSSHALPLTRIVSRSDLSPQAGRGKGHSASLGTQNTSPSESSVSSQSSGRFG